MAVTITKYLDFDMMESHPHVSIYYVVGHKRLTLMKPLRLSFSFMWRDVIFVVRVNVIR